MQTVCTKQLEKRKSNVYYIETKGKVDSHDQKCFLFTTATKTNPGQCRFLYRIFDIEVFW